MEGIHLKAVMKKVSIDKEGEANITVTVSSMYLKESLSVGILQGTVLDINITPETEKTTFK